MSNQNDRKPVRRMMGGPGMMAQGGEKAANFKGTWAKLIRYCSNYLPFIVLALVFAAAATVLQVIGPNQLSRMVDEIKIGIEGEINFSTITNIGIFLIVCYSLSAVLSFVQGYIMATVTARISRKLRTGISQKINKLPLKYYDNASYGDILSLVSNDVDTIGQTLNQSVGTLVTAITMLIGSLIMMFITNWILALTAISSSIIGFLLMMIIMKFSQKHFIVQQRGLGAVNGHIEEIYTNHNIVKAYNGIAKEKEKFEKINSSLFSSGWKSQFLSGIMMPLMNFVGNLGYVAVCVVGAVLVASPRFNVSFGVIVAFMIYVRLFTNPLSQLAQASQNLQSAAAASERVFAFFEEQEQEDEHLKQEKLEDVRGAVAFHNVRFGYNKDKIIINDFSADIKPGQKVAIVGPTGAGKTTMVNLLMRFYELDGGAITLDGVNISAIKREDVHKQFGMVLQDTWIFEGTIKENIVYSKENVSDEEVVAACKVVGLHHFIRTLPNGYNTVLSDRASLSEGQKQLLTIARAMILNAPLLILDEATSSVDTRTELLIQQAMDKLTKGRTSFVIAHRLSTIKNADLILVMKDGDIVESGKHQDLLDKSGFYATLYNSQFEGAN